MEKKRQTIKIDENYENEFKKLLFRLKKPAKITTPAGTEYAGEWAENSKVMRIPTNYYLLFQEIGGGDVKEGMYRALLLSHAIAYKEDVLNPNEIVMGQWTNVCNTISLLFDENHQDHLPKLNAFLYKFLKTGKFHINILKEETK